MPLTYTFKRRCDFGNTTGAQPRCHEIVMPGASVCFDHYLRIRTSSYNFYNACIVAMCDGPRMIDKSTLCKDHLLEFKNQHPDPQRCYHFRAWLRLRRSPKLHELLQSDLLPAYTHECPDCVGKGERWCTSEDHDKGTLSCLWYPQGCDGDNLQYRMCVTCKGSGLIPDVTEIPFTVPTPTFVQRMSAKGLVVPRVPRNIPPGKLHHLTLAGTSYKGGNYDNED